MAEKRGYLPLPDDWKVFKTRGAHSPEEIKCINKLFAGDHRLEEFGVGFWIDIYWSQRKRRRKAA